MTKKTARRMRKYGKLTRVAFENDDWGRRAPRKWLRRRAWLRSLYGARG